MVIGKINPKQPPINMRNTKNPRKLGIIATANMLNAVTHDDISSGILSPNFVHHPHAANAMILEKLKAANMIPIILGLMPTVFADPGRIDVMTLNTMA